MMSVPQLYRNLRHSFRRARTPKSLPHRRQSSKPLDQPIQFVATDRRCSQRRLDLDFLLPESVKVEIADWVTAALQLFLERRHDYLLVIALGDHVDRVRHLDRFHIQCG